MTAVAGRIREVIREARVLSMEIAALGDMDDLYHAGLTSHAAVHLMLGLKERFDVEFPDRLLRRRTFESVAAIEAAITELLNEKVTA